ncbi:MAG: flavodoxin [Bacteroidales bacterium]|nr:flavodoxin [Bacteroidales bacterium]MCD8395429.1 flavodoxin [Bacteroidales bacterium]
MKLISLLLPLLCLTSCTAQNKTPEKMNNKKVLVAYFSATGTTKAVAETIAEATDAQLYEITPETRYTSADLNWRDNKSRTSVEMNDPASRPALGGEAIDASAYDIIFIGYPIWWDLAPRIVNTWIESQRLDGKNVVPFATSGGSTIDGSVKDLRRLYPGIDWQSGKLLNGGPSKATNWAKTITE